MSTFYLILRAVSYLHLPLKPTPALLALYDFLSRSRAVCVETDDETSCFIAVHVVVEDETSGRVLRQWWTDHLKGGVGGGRGGCICPHV